MTQIKFDDARRISAVRVRAAAVNSNTKTIVDNIENQRRLLEAVNQKIHSNPEIAYEEHQAHDTLVQALQGIEGVSVTPHAFGIETSFLAEVGSGGRVVTFNAEYDALPGIGHACGHNLIATSSLGAFIGVAAALKRSGKPGRVRLLGTPAEENYGGKIALIEAGAFKDVDACLMSHPAPTHDAQDDVLGEAWSTNLATSDFNATFSGTPAHAALAPWEGVNALDAVVQGYNSVSTLRQQIRPDERVHGIISHGGDRPNIIPDHASVEYGVRAPTLARARVLKERVVNCFRGAATATGCTLDVGFSKEYADLRPNWVMAPAWQEAMASLGHKVLCTFNKAPVSASTDQGNVSYECPCFHGGFSIITPEGVSNHTRGFTQCAGTPDAFNRCVEVCKGMALLGFRVLMEDEFAEAVKKDFLKRVKEA